MTRNRKLKQRAGADLVIHAVHAFTAPARESARLPRRIDEPIIAHELPKRLRVKMPLLQRPRLDTGRLAEMLTEIAGVQSVRINAGAESIVIDYDGTSAARRSVLRELSSLALRDLPFREAPRKEAPSLAPLAIRAALLVAFPSSRSR